MKGTTIVIFLLAALLTILLIGNIVFFCLIQLKHSTNEEKIQTKSSLINPLFDACECGCSSIEPIFNDKPSTIGRIINGESAREHSWPWQMILLIIDVNRNPHSFCGATLISARHVLTAAHCVHQHIPPFIYLFPGRNQFHFNLSLTSGYRVKKMFVHEEFNVLLHHDIAILTLEQPLRFDSFISPICLAKSDSTPLKMNEELVVIGWGRISSIPGSDFYPEELQQMKVNYIPISHENCSEIFHRITNVHPGQICAGKQGSHACLGDSGGPLMRQRLINNSNQSYWEQIGIASKTIDCGWKSTSPDIYISIPYYYQWIINTIQRE